MWISKRQWRALENRVADLEKKIQDQSPENIAAEMEELTDRFSLTFPKQEAAAAKKPGRYIIHE